MKLVKETKIRNYYATVDGKILSEVKSTKVKKVLAESVNHMGYAKVCMGRKTYIVHNVIANAFIPNPDKLPTVDHINGNKRDNRVANLRWLSHRDNTNAQNYTPPVQRPAVKTFVDSVAFESMYKAADYIAKKEGKNANTIAKEISRFHNSNRVQRTFYKKYVVTK